jgi:hypothetical protein
MIMKTQSTTANRTRNKLSKTHKNKEKEKETMWR